MYRLSWPFAKVFAKLGCKILIKIDIIQDSEAQVYIGTSADLPGLVVEAESLDVLEREVWDLVPELLKLAQPKLLASNHALLSFSQAPVVLA